MYQYNRKLTLTLRYVLENNNMYNNNMTGNKRKKIVSNVCAWDVFASHLFQLFLCSFHIQCLTIFFSPPPSLSDSTGYNPKDFNASVMVNPAYF